MLAFWSCSPCSNPIYCGMRLVEKPILVFAIHDKHIQICMKKVQRSKTHNSNGRRDLGCRRREVETTLTLWSCSPCSNLINCGIELVEKICPSRGERFCLKRAEENKAVLYRNNSSTSSLVFSFPSLQGIKGEKRQSTAKKRHRKKIEDSET